MDLDRAIVCLVTDRRRLPGAAGSDTIEPLVNQARAAVRAGVDLIQVRESGLEAAELAGLVRAIAAIAREGSTRVVVNDRVDVALAAGADGVHLRADSMAPRAVRGMVPSRFLIGRSVHGVDEAREHAGAVDYLIAGTVFPTPSKPAAQTTLGPNGLRAIVSAVRVPVLAIGGITPERAAMVAAAGAAGIAAIGLFLEAGGGLQATVDSVRLEFDTARAAF
jgi:thiamine-phosphate pyrophosphorylase